MFIRKPHPIMILSIALLIHCAAMAASNTNIIADNQEVTYLRCLRAAADSAESAMDMALRWARLEGGNPAKHCQAVALRELGDFDASAALLEDLAEADGDLPLIKAELWSQAGRVWIDAQDFEKAVIAFNQSIALPNAPDSVYLDRAIVLAAMDRFWAAIDDLNVYLDIHQTDAFALTLRASAYRHIGSLTLSLDDIVRALEIEPANVNAWLERGIVMDALGNDKGALESWMNVLELEPDSPAADIVRARIEATAVGGSELGD